MVAPPFPLVILSRPALVLGGLLNVVAPATDPFPAPLDFRGAGAVAESALVGFAFFRQGLPLTTGRVSKASIASRVTLRFPFSRRVIVTRCRPKASAMASCEPLRRRSARYSVAVSVIIEKRGCPPLSERGELSGRLSPHSPRGEELFGIGVKQAFAQVALNV